ncbi:MAG: ribonuclease J [Pseudomonadota bacterium]|nr:ribonuclease J [Pseudomonadota bacterium]
MKYKKDNLVFLPLGGSGQIGMNCNLYHYNDTWIMVDLGVMFGDGDLSPYELIMPDLQFILERKNKLSALILTHAHEDHIGAVPYLYETLGEIPIYTTSFTASVLKRKFKSVGITNYDIRLLDYNKGLNIGPFFIEIFCLTHSIPEPNAIIIKTEKANIFHSGDWKIDPEPLIGQPINEKHLKKVIDEGIDVMICDSTNVFNENTSGSEGDVRKHLKKIFSKKEKGKIVITCFASNIARLDTILKVSEESNRCCLLLGRSLQRIFESAQENNYLKESKNIVNEKEAKLIPEDDLVVICTGSQGESRAALHRLVSGKHRFLRLNEKDLVIFSSREIPGNEKKINEIKTLVLKQGCNLLDQENSTKVHVSGHPSKKELKQMYEWISPKLLIPVHGEYRHLNEQVRYSKECGIKKQILVENGDLVRLDNYSVKKIIERVFSGKNVLRGNKILPINDKHFSDLALINKDGEIFVNLIMNLDNFLLSEPIIFCPSLFINEIDLNELKDLIEDNIKEFSKNSIDDKILSDQIRINVRSFVKMKIGLKPLTIIEIVRI